MKRIVAICAGFLAMFVIIGISIHSINNIEKMNERNQEKENAEELAISIASTTEGTDVWDYLRASTEPSTVPTESSDIAEEGSTAAQDGSLTTDYSETQQDPVSETVNLAE